MVSFFIYYYCRYVDVLINVLQQITFKTAKDQAMMQHGVINYHFEIGYCNHFV